MWLLAGFRKIGFNALIALAAVPVIHGSLSYPTQPG
jgi:Caleosin related protein